MLFITRNKIIKEKKNEKKYNILNIGGVVALCMFLGPQSTIGRAKQHGFSQLKILQLYNGTCGILPCYEFE